MVCGGIGGWQAGLDKRRDDVYFLMDKKVITLNLKGEIRRVYVYIRYLQVCVDGNSSVRGGECSHIEDRDIVLTLALY